MCGWPLSMNKETHLAGAGGHTADVQALHAHVVVVVILLVELPLAALERQIETFPSLRGERTMHPVGFFLTWVSGQ